MGDNTKKNTTENARDDARSRFSGFQEKRMKIFGELVKMYWNGQLNNVDDLNRLTAHIKDKFGFTEEDVPFIQDHIRIAMGLDPRQGQPYSDELDLVKKSSAVS
ncbi:MAG: hypothetical protein WAP56_10015, partial [Acetivibrionales bacterium]